MRLSDSFAVYLAPMNGCAVADAFSVHIIPFYSIVVKSLTTELFKSLKISIIFTHFIKKDLLLSQDNDIIIMYILKYTEMRYFNYEHI